MLRVGAQALVGAQVLVGARELVGLPVGAQQLVEAPVGARAGSGGVVRPEEPARKRALPPPARLRSGLEAKDAFLFLPALEAEAQFGFWFAIPANFLF